MGMCKDDLDKYDCHVRLVLVMVSLALCTFEEAAKSKGLAMFQLSVSDCAVPQSCTCSKIEQRRYVPLSHTRLVNVSCDAHDDVNCHVSRDVTSCCCQSLRVVCYRTNATEPMPHLSGPIERFRTANRRLGLD